MKRLGLVALLVSLSAAQPALADSAQDQALINAAALGEVSKVKNLLAQGAQLDARHPKSGWTPLFAACATGGAEVARLLLEAGADVNATTPEGMQPLTVAAYGGSTEVVKLLLVRKANVHHREQKAGATALHFAAMEGHVGAADALLEAGADPNSKSNAGLTPLVAAVKEKRRPIVLMLLNYKADPNLTTPDGAPLEIARKGGDQTIISLLIKKGAK